MSNRRSAQERRSQSGKSFAAAITAKSKLPRLARVPGALVRCSCRRRKSFVSVLPVERIWRIRSCEPALPEEI
jgi:hypothetical protein